MRDEGVMRMAYDEVTFGLGIVMKARGSITEGFDIFEITTVTLCNLH